LLVQTTLLITLQTSLTITHPHLHASAIRTLNLAGPSRSLADGLGLHTAVFDLDSVGRVKEERS
jgi:hypothetical protein